MWQQQHARWQRGYKCPNWQIPHSGVKSVCAIPKSMHACSFDVAWPCQNVFVLLSSSRPCMAIGGMGQAAVWAQLANLLKVVPFLLGGINAPNFQSFVVAFLTIISFFSLLENVFSNKFFSLISMFKSTSFGTVLFS